VHGDQQRGGGSKGGKNMKILNLFATAGGTGKQRKFQSIFKEVIKNLHSIEI
jgi:hypothetical protein